MKTAHLIATTAFVVFSANSASAAPPAPSAPMTMPMAPSTTTPNHSAQMHAVALKAETSKTAAERNILMRDNMAMMKVHMADMAAMTEQKPMSMPMVMDAAHMEKMGKHMAMMHQMMESLMVQQSLMMPPMK